MEMTGEFRIPAPRQRVWEALNDPEILKQSIPGCQTLEKVSDTSKLGWVLGFPLMFVAVMLMLAISDWLGRRGKAD